MENETLKQNGKEEGKEKGRINTGEKEGKDNPNGASTQFRVVINEEANAQLEAFVRQAGEGEEPVAISKSDLANYVFCNLSRFLSESDLKHLRSQYFDEATVLKGLVKKLKNENDLPQEIKRALRDYYGVSDREKKRPSKSVSAA